MYGAIGRRTSPENVTIDREFAASVRKQPFVQVNNPREPLIWAGAGNRYFAAILTPKPKNDSTYGFIASTSIESRRSATLSRAPPAAPPSRTTLSSNS